MKDITFPAQFLGTSDLANTRKKRRLHPPVFNVSESTIWRWVKQGVLPEPTYIGGKCFWHEEVVAHLLAQREQRTEEEASDDQ